LAHSVSARKRIRQQAKRRAHNASARSMFRTYVKNVVKAIDSGDQAAAEAAYKAAVPVIDGAASNGMIHKNKAARHKSRLNTRIRAMA
jgi:small subunit ribosomal protein S20